MPHLLRVFAAPLMLMLSACSGGTDSPAEEGAPGQIGEGLASGELEARVVQAELAKLDAMFGPFVRGETRVYEGTLEARDNVSALGKRPDGVLPRGPVIASLVFQGPSATFPATGELVVSSRVDGTHVDFSQPATTPGKTDVSLVLSEAAGGGKVQSCTGCLVELHSRPERFPVRLTAEGTYGDVHRTPSRVTASGELVLRSPETLRFTDLEALPSFRWVRAFEAVGAERVQAIEGSHVEGLLTQPGFLCCKRVTRYTLERFVHPENLGYFGVRNFRAQTPEETCARFIEACTG